MAIFVSYALQGYVIVDVLWRHYLSRLYDMEDRTIMEFNIRCFIVLATSKLMKSQKFDCLDDDVVIFTYSYDGLYLTRYLHSPAIGWLVLFNNFGFCVPGFNGFMCQV